jgi:beta-lactamase superfamily II metal-dependent hydrolase
MCNLHEFSAWSKKLRKRALVFAVCVSLTLMTWAADRLTGMLWPARDASAQTPSAAGTRLITLGTRFGPYPDAHQAQSSNLLIVNGTSYLIDAGDGTLRRLGEAGIRFNEIGVIFITHPHSDHIAGLGALMAAERNYGRKNPINVYGPPGVETIALRVTANGVKSHVTTRMAFGVQECLALSVGCLAMTAIYAGTAVSP